MKRLILLLSLLAVPFALRAQTSHTPPNFIQILTDDQGWGDLASFGHLQIQSPHIDGLAEEGIKFTHCYSSDAVCSPSRSSILTGRTPYRNGVYNWIPANKEFHLPASEITLPQLLRAEGYQTAHFGKWHLSHYSEVAIPDVKGSYRDFGFGGEHAGQPSMHDYGYDYWFATGNVARPNHENPLNFFLNGEAMGKMEGFSAQIVAAEFVKWMTQHRQEGQPFFVTVWFHEPHGPVNSDSEFVKRYEDLKDPSLQQYLANITQIDEGVGTMVAALKEAGVYDDTLIWYTSDNGPEGPHGLGDFNNSDSPYGPSRYRGSTGGLRGRKRHTHEGGIRVPGIVSWPKGFQEAGIRPGTLCAEPMIGSDVFPTMLEIAGVELPHEVVYDSSSILPLLQGKTFQRERPLYWRNNHYEFKIALRHGDWKILGTPTHSKFELYHLMMDPRETTDLSAQAPERFEAMKRMLIEYDNEVLAEGPKWWTRKKDKK